MATHNIDKDDYRDDTDWLRIMDDVEAPTTVVDVDARWFAKRERIYRQSEELLTDLQRRREANDLGDNRSILTDKTELSLFRILQEVNALLLEEEPFYAYFFMNMEHVIDLTMPAPMGVALQKSRYVLYVNPFILLHDAPDTMKDHIKRQVLHIISSHLWRAPQLCERYYAGAVHMAMDMVVNDYLHDLPRDAVTVAWVNQKFQLDLKRFRSLEHYARALDEVWREHPEQWMPVEQPDHDVATVFDPLTSHDVWNQSDQPDRHICDQITERYIQQAEKGDTSGYIASLITAFQKQRETLPWYMYLKKLIGKVASGRKKTTMRRNRRQPERLELSGSLRQHKANVWVALDMSGSISDEEFTRALEQVLHIVKAYSHQVTVVECDNEVRRQYVVKDMRDIKVRLETRGGTAFSPVIELANKNNVDLLVYITDGKGEMHLKQGPKGYKILWVLSGHEQELSLRASYGIVRKLQTVEADETVDIDEFLRISSRSGYSMANQEVMNRKGL